MTAIDAIVIAYRSEGEIDACLRALRSVSAIDRILVIDHGDGQSASRAEALGATTLHDPANPGFGAGHNRGVRMGHAPYLLLVNPDAAVIPAAVARGLDLLEERPDVAAVQGAILSTRTGALERSQGREVGPLHLIARALGLRTLLRHRAVRALARRLPVTHDHVERRPRTAGDVATLAATALLLRRSAFEEVGGFSTRYFLYGEDLDLCRRLRLAGWHLVATPDDWATHTSGGSAVSTRARELAWWNGTLTFAAEWWPSPRWALAMAASALQSARLTFSNPAEGAAVARALLVEPCRQRARSRRERGQHGQPLACQPPPVT